MFKQHFPYLKGNRVCVTDVVNFPYIFVSKNIEKYDKKLILVNSRFTSEAVKRFLGITSHVLYPPVSDSFLSCDFLTKKEEQRENIIVTIGRITADKRIEIIPEIAKKLCKIDASFYIIGFAHDPNILHKVNVTIEKFGLTKKIHILSDASRKEIKTLLRRAKVYFHPPTIEHFGISIAEAMGQGCIPVVYEVGGAREFVPEEFRYATFQEATDNVQKAIITWSLKEARRMNSIANRFSETHFRQNFMEIFEEHFRE
jgi:glycosyltransferase involved in cell wall biosynthesis